MFAYAPRLSDSLHRTSLSVAYVLQLRTLVMLLALVYVCNDIDGSQYSSCMV